MVHRTIRSNIWRFWVVVALAMALAIVGAGWPSSFGAPASVGPGDNGGPEEGAQGAPIAAAAPVPITVSQQWDGETSDVPPAFFWPGGGVVPADQEFTYDSGGDPVVILVTDAFCKGDRFRVFVDGFFVGDTTAVAVGGCPAPGDVGGPVDAWTIPGYSKGIFNAPAGAHTISIQVIANPFSGGRGYISVHFKEKDPFPNSVGVVALETPGGEVTKVLFGPATAIVDIGPIGEALDTDGDGLDQVKTEMVQLQLSSSDGFSVMLRSSDFHPHQRSLGEIEEKVNNTPGILDIDPFKPGDANSFFDIFFELDGPGLPGPLHNDVPLHIQTVITEKPPATGQTYVHVTGPIELRTQDEKDSGIKLLSSGHTPKPPPMDHFKCHDVTGKAINVPVDLVDQFDKLLNRVEQKTVVKPLRLCNPVDKTVDGVTTGVTNPNAHLKFYQILPLDPTPRPVWSVTVNNQFGRRTFKVTNPVELAVPTQKLPHDPFSGVDHFKCYTVTGGQAINKVVDLNDQFDLEKDVTVLTPFRFCNPVQKTHAGKVTEVQHPKDHLVCYKLTRKVTTRNQFGSETLTVKNTDLLCVPSEKSDVKRLSGPEAAAAAAEAAAAEAGTEGNNGQ